MTIHVLINDYAVDGRRTVDVNVYETFELACEELNRETMQFAMDENDMGWECTMSNSTYCKYVSGKDPERNYTEWRIVSRWIRTNEPDENQPKF
jgi:hypothetical protein